MTRDMHGAPLRPGVNVDRVNAAAGAAAGVKLGFSSALDEMVTLYALLRWARGEEEGADRTWLRYHPHDLTSWRAILAAAIVSNEKE